ncbi:hypothetical protein, partial [Kitasatospora putterlickiae]|uniref:hypothetical protein n=1 Tax=Kitasatospora putterlickiae TaxID=221725 RepID=UPI0031D4C13E
MAAYLDRDGADGLDVPAQDAPPPPPELVALARAHGVDTRCGPGGVPAGARTLTAVLAALGVDAATPEAA